MSLLRKILLVVALSVAIVEATSRLVSSIPPMVVSLEPERVWEDRFVEAMRRGHTIVMAGFHRPHPTRGWTVAPNAHETFEGFTYTTNEKGHRSLSPSSPDASRYTVLAVGDSFTFGVDANDTETWPYLLQSKDPRLNVINLGVGGYGIDQMYLVLEESIREYHPQLVIVAFIGDDLHRALLSFRDYKKPRFVLERGELRLTNVPIGSPEVVLSEINNRRQWLDGFYTLRILRGIGGRVFGYSAPPPGVPLGADERALIAQLFDEMHAIGRKHRAEFLLVYFSYGDGIFDPTLLEEGEEFLRSYTKQRQVAAVDMRPFFLAQSPRDWVKGHFQAHENRLVSDTLYDRIRPMMGAFRTGLPSDTRSQ